MRQADNPSGIGEADNLARLGKRVFVYGFLTVLGNFGLLAVLVTVGVPLDGPFGGVMIERLIFRGLAGCALILATYAWVVGRETQAHHCREAFVRLLLMGAVYFFFSVDYGDMRGGTVRILQWVNQHCAYILVCAAEGRDTSSGPSNS